jgi:hypothetical protein
MTFERFFRKLLVYNLKHRDQVWRISQLLCLLETRSHRRLSVWITDTCRCTTRKLPYLELS